MEKISPFTLIGVFVVLVLLNFETLFAIRHHLPGGIDLSIGDFCNFIIYCFLASLIISIISLRILRKFSQSLARFRNFAFLCTRFLFLILHFISLFIQGLSCGRTRIIFFGIYIHSRVKL